MKIGANGFGLRDSFAKGMDAAIAELRGAGLSSVEVCVDFLEKEKEEFPGLPEDDAFKNIPYAIWPVDTAAEKIKTLREGGLAVISCHVMGFFHSAEEMAPLAGPILQLASQTGIKNYVISPMKDVDSIGPYIPVLKELSDTLAANGLRLLLHNHEAECMVKDETCALAMLLDSCPNLGLELDCGWAKFAGRDALALMDSYRDRLLLVHLKDIKADASPATRDTCFTAIGEGSIPLADILKKAKELGICQDGIIIDQDASAGSMIDDLKTGVCNINALSR